MQIDDLTAGLSLSFLINLNTEQLQFESKILEVYPHRHTLLAQGVFTDDKIISFRGKGLIVDLIVTLPEDKPQLFKNVTTNVVKLSDGTRAILSPPSPEAKPITAGKATAAMSASKLLSNAA